MPFSQWTNSIRRVTAAVILASVIPGPASAAPSLNPDVTQATIQSTICRKGYTDTVRPSTSYTNPIKFRLMAEAGIPREHADELALDHTVPLTLGGHPRQLSNLRLMSKAENGRKSRIEVKLACFVCNGQMTLSKAQDEVARDWRQAYSEYAGVKCRRGR